MGITLNMIQNNEHNTILKRKYADRHISHGIKMKWLHYFSKLHSVLQVIFCEGKKFNDGKSPQR